MQRISMIILLAVIAMVVIAPRSQAGIDVGVSIDSDGIKGFYLAIGEHYDVKEKNVIVVREGNIPDEELPVVFFLARNAGVAPVFIVKLRLGGKSWMDIAFHYGLTAEIFYVKFDRDPGPPYGKAWGHFKKKKHTEWKTIRLADVDIVNFVNLKFVSEHYGHTPAEVVKMRAKGDGFVAIHKQAKAHKKQHQKKVKAVASSDNPKHKGKPNKKKK